MGIWIVVGYVLNVGVYVVGVYIDLIVGGVFYCVDFDIFVDF